jgi:AcrR family transcriptional regulator
MTIDQPRWTRQPPDVRRRQLLDAASEVILEKGFDAMTVSEVADRAGVGKGTVYLYFDSKTSLLLGVQDRYWERMLEVVERIIDAESGSWVERLDQLVDDLVSFSVTEIDNYHVLFHDTPTTEGKPLAEFADLISELLRRGTKAGEFDVSDATVTAAFLMGALNGTVAKTAHFPAKPRARAVAVLQTLFRRTVGAV